MNCVGSPQNIDKLIDFEEDPYLFEKMSWCFFPGSPIFKASAEMHSTSQSGQEG